jgi:hypothetical protein
LNLIAALLQLFFMTAIIPFHVGFTPNFFIGGGGGGGGGGGSGGGGGGGGCGGCGLLFNN